MIGRAEPDAEIQDLLLASAGPNLGVDFLPGALPFRPPAGPAPTPELAAGDRLVRRARDERRPHRAEHEPAALARPALADRPRRRALLPPRRRPIRASTRGGRSRRSPTTCCCRSPARSPRPTSGSRRAVTRELLERDRRRDPGRVARRRRPRRLRRLPARRGSRRRARSSPRPRRPVSAGSPFSYAIVRVVPRVERGERINAGVIVFCRPLGYLAARTQLDERAARRARARPRPRRRCAPHLDAIERIAAGDATAGPIAQLDVTAALPLARRAVEHDHPAVRGAHRPLRRSRRAARAALPRAGVATS